MAPRGRLQALGAVINSLQRCRVTKTNSAPTSKSSFPWSQQSHQQPCLSLPGTGASPGHSSCFQPWNSLGTPGDGGKPGLKGNRDLSPPHLSPAQSSACSASPHCSAQTPKLPEIKPTKKKLVLRLLWYAVPTYRHENKMLPFLLGTH